MMILNMMDLMTNDDITENPDGIRLKPDITANETEWKKEEKKMKISYLMAST